MTAPRDPSEVDGCIPGHRWTYTRDEVVARWNRPTPPALWPWALAGLALAALVAWILT